MRDIESRLEELERLGVFPESVKQVTVYRPGWPYEGSYYLKMVVEERGRLRHVHVRRRDEAEVRERWKRTLEYRRLLRLQLSLRESFSTGSFIMEEHELC
ncbi:MAG: hypothetical protein QXU26_04245 [Thermofilaceae archaeon]